jgi:hypothetical protein
LRQKWKICQWPATSTTTTYRIRRISKPASHFCCVPINQCHIFFCCIGVIARISTPRSWWTCFRSNGRSSVPSY